MLRVSHDSIQNMSKWLWAVFVRVPISISFIVDNLDVIENIRIRSQMGSSRQWTKLSWTTHNKIGVAECSNATMKMTEAIFSRHHYYWPKIKKSDGGLFLKIFKKTHIHGSTGTGCDLFRTITAGPGEVFCEDCTAESNRLPGKLVRAIRVKMLMYSQYQPTESRHLENGSAYILVEHNKTQ